MNQNSQKQKKRKLKREEVKIRKKHFQKRSRNPENDYRWGRTAIMILVSFVLGVILLLNIFGRS